MKAYLKRPKYRYKATTVTVEVDCTGCGKTQYIQTYPSKDWRSG